MKIEIVNDNILRVHSDLLILKYAEGFHGADAAVARAIGYDGKLTRGEHQFHDAKGTAARAALFIGVGPLRDFRYENIQTFSQRAFELAVARTSTPQHIVLTNHGPGYGLDTETGFLSLVSGLHAAWKNASRKPVTVSIAELSSERCELYRRCLSEHSKEFDLVQASEAGQFVSRDVNDTVVRQPDTDFGARADRMPRLFVAMPF